MRNHHDSNVGVSEAVFHAHNVSKIYNMGEVEVQALRSVTLDLYEPRYILVVLGCFLWASYILAHILDYFHAGLVARILETVGAEWFGIIFLLLVALLFVDIVTLFGWVWPRFAALFRVWAIVAAGLLARRLPQPLIVGGIVVGPFAPGPSVHDFPTIELLEAKLREAREG